MNINKDLAELIGIIIGDGNIHYNEFNRKYFVEITGNPKKEKIYFEYISNLFQKILGKSGKISVRGRGLRLRVYSKSFVSFLIYHLKMYYGMGKSLKTSIPSKILKNKSLFYSCIRGIFDTDGSFFVSKKGNNKNYPSIEISTCSIVLANQIKEELSNDFRVIFRINKNKGYTLGERYILALNGKDEIKKWFSTIGSSNRNKLDKYENFLLRKNFKKEFLCL